MTISDDAPESGRTAPDDGSTPDGSRFVRHDHDAEAPASFAVIGAIADLEGVSPTAVHTDLGLTLYDHVDPERLDSLLESGDGDGSLTVSFDLGAYSVEIVDGESLSVARRE